MAMTRLIGDRIQSTVSFLGGIGVSTVGLVRALGGLDTEKAAASVIGTTIASVGLGLFTGATIISDTVGINIDPCGFEAIDGYEGENSDEWKKFLNDNPTEATALKAPELEVLHVDEGEKIHFNGDNDPDYGGGGKKKQILEV
jgi:hypothetical protein